MGFRGSGFRVLQVWGLGLRGSYSWKGVWGLGCLRFRVPRHRGRLVLGICCLRFKIWGLRLSLKAGRCSRGGVSVVGSGFGDLHPKRSPVRT